MAEIGQNPTLGEAAGFYLAYLSPEKKGASQQEVSKFVRWFGREKPFGGLTGADVEDYADGLSLSDAEYLGKLELIRAFLAYAKKQGWSKTNLATHLKSKKGKTKTAPVVRKEAAEVISLTVEGKAKLEAELAGLRDERLHVIEEMRKAAADKDFRENAPLHAARERRGHIEGRITELEAVLKAAVLIDEKQNSGIKVNIGDRVILCEANSEEELCYTLVSPREVNVAQGKISNASPLGQAILGKEQGETVEIQAPVGKLYYRIKRIER